MLEQPQDYEKVKLGLSSHLSHKTSEAQVKGSLDSSSARVESLEQWRSLNSLKFSNLPLLDCSFVCHDLIFDISSEHEYGTSILYSFAELFLREGRSRSVPGWMIKESLLSLTDVLVGVRTSLVCSHITDATIYSVLPITADPPSFNRSCPNIFIFKYLRHHSLTDVSISCIKNAV